jgi:hypothetical protein
MTFKLQKVAEVQHYKRDYKDRKSGFVKLKDSVKKIDYKSYETELSKTLSFLAKYGVQASYKQSFMQRAINKFGIERLLALAKLKRDNVLMQYPEPVNFTSLTFRGRSRLKSPIVDRNRNTNSVIKGFVSISWPKTTGLDVMTIPVKLHSRYHGNLSDYSNNTDTSYIIKVQRNSVVVILTRDGDRHFPEVSLDEHEIEGFDVNTKHNMVISESGYGIQHDHKIVKAIIDHEKKTDALRAEAKRLGNSYELGKRRKAKSDALSNKYIDYIEREAVTCCKTLHDRGKRHFVFENLQGGWSKTYATSNEYDVNHNRLTKIVSYYHQRAKIFPKVMRAKLKWSIAK